MGVRPAVLAFIFALAFAVRALYAVDLAPFMYRPQQPGTRMTARYDDVAVRILEGGGILYPTHPDPKETGLMARPPGYSLYLAAIYRALGRDLFAAQLVQNLLTSIACVLAAELVARLISPRTGVTVGLIAAASPHLGFASNLVLPDALSALPLLLSLLLVTKAHPDRPGGVAWSAGAGAVIGAGAWLRPNVVLWPGLLALALFAVARDRRRALRHGIVLVAAAAAVVVPITVRNWIVFHQWVPISTNGGLTFWQGVADAGGTRYGSFRRDKLVAAEEAARYGRPDYATWWAEPDGVFRDHERYRRGWEVIRAHPGAYARVMLGRMAGMVDYDDGLAPKVSLPGEKPVRRPADPDDEIEAAEIREQQRAGEKFLAPGHALALLRPPLRLVQEILTPALLPLMLVGLPLLLWLEPRRSVLLLALSAYYLLTESFFILEWRVVVPMHYGLFAASAVTLLVVLRAADRTGRRLLRRVGARA